MIFTGTSINDVWFKILEALYEDDINNVLVTSPRGMETREILGPTIELLDPQSSILGSSNRKMNYQFMVAEALWMLSGFNRVDLIEPYNLSLGKFAADPGASHFQGAYGPRILDQLDYVVQVLLADRDSRQAVLTIWRPRPRASADVACTVAMQFLIRNEQLHMHTYMRSQDVWLGTPYDIFNFTLLQQLVANRIGDVLLGTYRHTMGSMHMYQRNYDDVEAVIANRQRGDLNHRLPLIESVPMASIAAAYAELTTIAPNFARESSRGNFVRDWYDKWEEHLGGVQPWSDFLVVIARRFHPSFNKFSDPGWDMLMWMGR